MANRIQDRIDSINEKMKTVDPAKLKELDKTLKTDFTELCEYQKLQSMAFACGKLSYNEAQTLYRIYGGEVPSASKWDELSIAEKVVGTQTASELLKMRICNIL